MKLYRERLEDTSTPDLLVILRFFDDQRLRRHYTGLIGDIRTILRRRKVCPVCGTPGLRDRESRMLNSTCDACGWHFTADQ